MRLKSLFTKLLSRALTSPRHLPSPRDGQPAPGVDSVQLIRQSSTIDCGPACLAMVLTHHGIGASYEEVRAASKLGRTGMDLASLLEAARAFGLEGQALQVSEVGDLKALVLPAVLHLRPRHYVVLEGFTPDGAASLADPSSGHRLESEGQLGRRLSGKVLCLYKPAPTQHSQN